MNHDSLKGKNKKYKKSTPCEGSFFIIKLKNKFLMFLGAMMMSTFWKPWAQTETTMCYTQSTHASHYLPNVDILPVFHRV